MTQAELDDAGPQGDRKATAGPPAHRARLDLIRLRRLQGGEAPADIAPPRDANGRIPVVRGQTARALQERHARVREEPHGYAARRAGAGLDHLHPAWHGHEVSTRRVLWHPAEHSIPHEGQSAG